MPSSFEQIEAHVACSAGAQSPSFAGMDPKDLHVALTRYARSRLEPAFPDGSPALLDAARLRRLEAGFVAFALDRRYAYHSVGALGAVELTAPGRVAQVDRGLARLGVPRPARRYFTLHATLDLKHSEAWNREVLRPLVASEPRAASAIAEGALMRLRAGERCFERYRRELRSEPAELAENVAVGP